MILLSYDNCAPQWPCRDNPCKLTHQMECFTYLWDFFHVSGCKEPIEDIWKGRVLDGDWMFILGGAGFLCSTRAACEQRLLSVLFALGTTKPRLLLLRGC